MNKFISLILSNIILSIALFANDFIVYTAIRPENLTIFKKENQNFINDEL